MRRHQRKIFVALGLSATVYWAYSYLEEKLKELKQNIIFERLTREDMERRFEQNQRDATFTTMALLPTLSTQILAKYDVEATRQELQNLRGKDQAMTASSELVDSLHSEISANGDGSASIASLDASYVAAPSKADLWNQIKFQSLTRAFLLIYTNALLVVFTRIQLNILGRRSYTESISRAMENNKVVELNEEDEADDINRQYLTFSWWLLHRGWQVLAARVEGAVRTVMKDVEPPRSLGYDTLSGLVGQIHREIDDHGNFLNVLLPPAELYTFVLNQIPGEEVGAIDEKLESLVSETVRIIDSQNCSEVVKNLVHSGLSTLMKKVQAAYGDSEEMRLASVLMLASKQAHQMAAGSPLSNEYIENMVENVPELDALCAKVYSDF